MLGMAQRTTRKRSPTLPSPGGGGKERDRETSGRGESTRSTRAIWSGTISFGLVSIPVRLYTATQSHDVHFHLLHKKDGVRLQNVRWCPKDEKAVPWDEVVRGFEYAKGNYVPITEEDLDHLPVKTVHTVDISDFVKLEEVDPIYYDKAYYLAPKRPVPRRSSCYARRSSRLGARRSPRSRFATRRVSAWCGRIWMSSRWIRCSTRTKSDQRKTSRSTASGCRPTRS